MSIAYRGRSRTGGLSLLETGPSSGSTPFPLTNPSRSFPFKGSSEPGRIPGCRVSKPVLVEKNSLKGGTRRFNPGETGTNPDPSRVRAGMGQAFTIVPRVSPLSNRPLPPFKAFLSTRSKARIDGNQPGGGIWTWDQMRMTKRTARHRRCRSRGVAMAVRMWMATWLALMGTRK